MRLERVPEAELMLSAAQASAYANADFSEPNAAFVDHLQALAGGRLSGLLLDLGCGPADICVRLARRHPELEIHAVDGSPVMLECARQRLELERSVAGRILLVEAVLPLSALPCRRYDLVTSNSLLHHLHDPRVLWDDVRRYGRSGAPVLVMDLCRPESEAAVASIVRRYAAGEPAVLQHDFRASLRAAFTREEVSAQLHGAGLAQLEVRQSSDRHLLVSGFLP